MQFTSKLPHVGTTIFTVMSHLANKHGALNLSQGFPNFPCSDTLIELVYKHMKAGQNQYAPMQGVSELREVICAKVNELYGSNYQPDTDITITSGATQAIYTAISTVVQPQDEVIVIEPAYDSYVPAIEMAGGVPVYVQLQAPHFSLDWEEVRAKITDKTRLIIINSPHNPTGAVFSEADMRALESIVQESNIFVLSDEVYEHLTFDGQAHESVAKYPGLRERSFISYSFGKVFHVTGWRIGYCLAPTWLMQEFRKIHQFEVFSINRPFQMGLADFLQTPENYLSLPSFFQQKRDRLLEELKKSPFEIIPSAGTYFQLLQYGHLSQEKDTDYAVRLTKEIGVASIPISAFYHDKRDDKIIRLCFAKTDEMLVEASRRLCQI